MATSQTSCRMRERGRRPGDRHREVGVQRQPQPVADDRLVHRRGAGRQRHRRRPVEDLADLEIVEVGPAGLMTAHRHSLPYEYFAISSCLYSLPVSVRGSCASNEIERGHL